MASNHPQELLQSIVVATDFSARSEKAELYASTLARKFGATLIFVHAIEAILSSNDDDGHDEFKDFYARLTRNARERLEERLREAHRRGIEARYHVEVGARWQIVLERAEVEEADLIVIGRRAYQERGNVPLGTTSQRVYFSSRRPVLIVPLEDEQ